MLGASLAEILRRAQDDGIDADHHSTINNPHSAISQTQILRKAQDDEIDAA